VADLLNSNEIFYRNWEPKTKNRFILYMDGIPSFLITKCKRPTVKSDKKTLDHINLQRYYKGKTTWDDITMELYDPVVPSGAQAVMEWIRLGHESVTGRDGYQDFYKKDLTMNILGPVGDKVEEWTLKGAWCSQADFQEGDWSDMGDPLKIALTVSVDYCILQY
jgi:hypothetical protein